MPALSLNDLHKKYQGGFQALSGVTLDVQEGEFFGLLGPNGAGKTTTIGIITSLVTKTSGRVRVFGIDIDDDFPAAKRLIGVVPQEANFSIFEKVQDIVTQQAGYYGIPRREALVRSEKYLKKLGLWDKRQVAARELSGGMKRRLMIARGLVHEPKLLILDEPTAGVDVEMRRGMWDFLTELNRQGRTIILTTHYLEEAETLCSRIAMLKQGRVVALDTTQNLLHMHSGCYVELRLRPDRLPESLAHLVALRREGGHRLALPDYNQVERVIAELRASGVEIQELEVMQPDLEEIFVQIMQRP